MAIQITDEQKYAGRASKVVGEAQNFAVNLKRFIEDGVAPQPNGEFVNTGLTGWKGFTDEQKSWLQAFIHDGAGSIIIEKK